MNTLVTVFIPTYDHEGSVARAIESVLAQKTRFQFVVKILEDCSTDGTLAICESYARQYSGKVVLISQPRNTGALHVREALKHQIKTPYFHFLDGDDWLTDEDYLDRAVSFLEGNHNCNLHLANCMYREQGKETDCLSVQGATIESLGHAISFENYAYLHTSTRVYRKVFDFASMDRDGYPFEYDIFLYWLYLDTGGVHLEGSQPVSVYNIHAKGVWSRMSDREKTDLVRWNAILAAKYFHFRHAGYFMRQYQPDGWIRTMRKYLGDRLSLSVLSMIGLDKKK